MRETIMAEGDRILAEQDAFAAELSRLAKDPALEREGLGWIKAHRHFVNRALTQTWESALHITAEAGSGPLTKALIEAGADIERETVSDATPLMAACLGGPGALGAARELLKAGADAKRGSILCESALRAVVITLDRRPVEESLGLCEELIKAGCPMEAAWDELAGVMGNRGDQDKKERLMEALLGAGMSIDAKDQRGDAALLRALTWCNDAGETRQVEFLLAKGANPNQPSGRGASLLRLCAEAGRLGPRPKECDDLIRLLLAAGADPFMKEEGGPSLAELVKDPRAKASRHESARALILAWVESVEMERAAAPAAPRRGPSL